MIGSRPDSVARRPEPAPPRPARAAPPRPAPPRVVAARVRPRRAQETSRDGWENFKNAALQQLKTLKLNNNLLNWDQKLFNEQARARPRSRSPPAAHLPSAERAGARAGRHA